MDKLGYRRFGAYGSDWGTGITTQLGTRFPDRLIGTAVPGPPPRTNREPRTPEERAYFESIERYTAEETAYQHIQGTKPQSLAYGLTDSPAGVAAWVVEKLRAWSDCKGDVERKFTKDQILTLVSIYWHTRTIGTAIAHLLFDRQVEDASERETVGHAAAGQRETGPTGILGLLRHHLTRTPAEVARRQGAGERHALVLPRDRRSLSGDRGIQASRRGSANVLPTAAFGAGFMNADGRRDRGLHDARIDGRRQSQPRSSRSSRC